jgi:hypothetical protein
VARLKLLCDEKARGLELLAGGATARAALDCMRALPSCF